MQYEEKEFSGLMLPDIFNLKDDDDAFIKYPILTRYPEFNAEIDYYNRFLKYISFIYDSNSPLHVINHIPTRKSEAMQLAGFERNANGMFPKECEETIRCLNKKIMLMVVKYIRLQKNATFAKRITYEESFYNQLSKLQSGTVDDEKSKDLINNIERLEDLINKTNFVLLNGDMNKNLTELVAEEILEEQLLIRPEFVARAIKEGKNMKVYFGKARNEFRHKS